MLQILGVIASLLLGIVALAGVALAMRDQDDPLKMKIITRLGWPTRNCPDCGKLIPSGMRKCSACKSKEWSDGVSAIAGLFGAAIGVAILVGLVRAGFSILQGIDLASLNPELQKAIQQASVDLGVLQSGGARLERAETLLNANDKISIDQAAMLTCATLEGGLRMLSQRNGVPQNLGEQEGMVDLAQRLKERNLISYDDVSGIKHLVHRVRNPVMHGDFDSFEPSDVRDQIDFTRTFLNKYQIIKN